jgi:hypothetical protein
MSEREFKNASEAVEFYREQVRTQNGYAMQQRLRAEEAEAERDQCAEAYRTLQKKYWAERDRLREENVRLLHHVGKRAEAEAERDRLRAQVSELAGTVEWRDREVARLRNFKRAIEAAHAEHLRTGDYTPLGIAAQDALLALERDRRRDQR